MSSSIGRTLASVLVLTAVGGWPLPACSARPADPPPGAETVALPSPRLESAVSLEETLRKRRSVRSYRDEPLSLAEVSQLLWAAQGVTLPAVGYRTAPSAGATFPLEVYLIAGHVTGLPTAVYRYRPGQHQLVKVLDGGVREAVALDLGSVVIGAFRDDGIKRVVRLEADEQPLYLIAVGRL
jgi:nitroreductase